MKTFIKPLLTFWHEESGLTAVEYAVAGAVIVTATVAVFNNLGNAVGNRITAITTAITPAA